MKKILIPIFLILLISCHQEKIKIDKNQEVEQLNAFMDSWHHAAAVADENIFFGSMDSNAVYLGTDPSERWTKQEFMDWGIKYFQRDTAWAFAPYHRVWELSDDARYAWFDELLETHMGICRGSGVLIHNKNGWKIKQYNLALTLPNERMDEFRQINKKVLEAD